MLPTSRIVGASVSSAQLGRVQREQAEHAVGSDPRRRGRRARTSGAQSGGFGTAPPPVDVSGGAATAYARSGPGQRHGRSGAANSKRTRPPRRDHGNAGDQRIGRHTRPDETPLGRSIRRSSLLATEDRGDGRAGSGPERRQAGIPTPSQAAPASAIPRGSAARTAATRSRWPGAYCGSPPPQRTTLVCERRAAHARRLAEFGARALRPARRRSAPDRPPRPPGRRCSARSPRRIPRRCAPTSRTGTSTP